MDNFKSTKTYNSIEDLTLNCPEFFDTSYKGSEQSLEESGNNLFQEYRKSINVNISEEANRIHQYILELKQQSTSFDAMNKLIDDIATLLLTNTSTLNISKSLGISHFYVKKISNFLDSKLEHECKKFDASKKLYSLTKNNDYIINSLNNKFNSLDKKLKDKGKVEISATEIKKMRMLSDGILDGINTQTRTVMNMEKIKPKDYKEKSNSEKAIDRMHEALVDMVEDIQNNG